MKKQALLATISLALVALASCGGSTPSDSVSVSGGGSDSTPAELTLQEQWEAVTMFQGVANQGEFFAKTATITNQSRNAKSRSVLSEDLSGEVGNLFGMEDDWGFLNQRYEATCSIYNNDVKVCNSEETTEHTADDGVTINTDVVNQTVHAYVDQATNTYYAVVDDGSGTYAVPNNYYTSKVLESGETFAALASFALSTNSGIGQRLSLAYYQANSSDTTIKYFAEEVAEGTAYTYWSFADFTSEGYVGHTFSIKISAVFNGATLKAITLEQGYFYYGAAAFYSNQYLYYDYEDNGDFSGALLDHNLYKVYGTVVADVEDGDLDANFNTYVTDIINAKVGEENALEFMLPTMSQEQNYMYRESDDYVSLETLTTTVYSDGYVVRDGNKQERINNQVVTTTSTYQLSADDTIVYEIYKDYDESQYKVTTPISEEVTYESMSDISEVYAINQLYSLLNSGYEMDYAAYSGADGLIEIYLKAVVQQTETTAAWIYEVDIGFYYVKDDAENVVGLAIDFAVFAAEAQSDWETLLQVVYEAVYAYDEAITTTEANYEPLLPSNYEERVEDPEE